MTAIRLLLLAAAVLTLAGCASADKSTSPFGGFYGGVTGGAASHN